MVCYLEADLHILAQILQFVKWCHWSSVQIVYCIQHPESRMHLDVAFLWQMVFSWLLHEMEFRRQLHMKLQLLYHWQERNGLAWARLQEVDGELVSGCFCWHVPSMTCFQESWLHGARYSWHILVDWGYHCLGKLFSWLVVLCHWDFHCLGKLFSRLTVLFRADIHWLGRLLKELCTETEYDWWLVNCNLDKQSIFCCSLYSNHMFNRSRQIMNSIKIKLVKTYTRNWQYNV